MRLKELVKYDDENIPVIEFYNKDNQLEYLVDLRNYEFVGLDVVYDIILQPYGAIKLKEKDETEFNDKEL